MVAGAVLVGFAVRALFVFSSSFPLNDGGMFFAMVRDVQGAGYTIPRFTSYNGSHIPFAYPPLGFYLAAVLDDATPLGLVQVFRLLPLLFSTLTIVAFFLLARDMIRSRIVVATAVLFFALLPPSFTWMIMGGGLTRALGFMLGLLTVREVRRLYVDGARWRIATASLLAAMTVLSHLEMAWFACLVSALFFVSLARTHAAVLHSGAVAVATVLLTAPWWLLLLVRHGLSPMLAAAHSTQSSWWQPIALLVQFDVTTESGFALMGTLALLGVIVLLARREWMLPGWIAAMAFLDQRAFVTSGAPAAALLAAVGLHEVVLPLVFRARPLRTETDGADGGVLRLTRAPVWLGSALILLVVVYPALGAIANTPGLLQGLSNDERAAMAWAGVNTPPSARFLVISGRAWPVDRSAEWFPVLAERKSVATVQGYEWLRGHAFDAQRNADAHVQECADSDAACLASWSTGTGQRFDYVYVETVPPAGSDQLTNDTHKTCCDGLRAALRGDPRYTTVFDGPGATIFQRIGS
jgi:hypothetical protein